jgi:hypothetical protein
MNQPIAAKRRANMPLRDGGDFNDRPFLVFWEITRSCALACRHCRAGRPAQAERFHRKIRGCRRKFSSRWSPVASSL